MPKPQHSGLRPCSTSRPESKPPQNRGGARQCRPEAWKPPTLPDEILERLAAIFLRYDGYSPQGQIFERTTQFVGVWVHICFVEIHG